MMVSRDEKMIAFRGIAPIIRLGMISALNRDAPRLAGELKFVEADAGEEEILTLAALGRLDLVIVDPGEPSMNAGLAFCRDLKKIDGGARILVFCQNFSQRELLLASTSGIDSFVHSYEDTDRLGAAVLSTLGGSREWLLGPLTEQVEQPDAHLAMLTEREREVLWLVSERCTNEQIAQALSISAHTAKNHVASVLRKLAVTRRSELFATSGLPMRHRHVRS